MTSGSSPSPAAEPRHIPPLGPYFLAMGVSLGSLASVITLLGELRDEYGMTPTQVGVIVGVGFFVAFVSQLTLGRLADQGHAPLMVRIGLVVAAASLVLFGLGSSFVHFVGARSLLGLSVGIAQPAIRRTVILADPPNTGHNIGRVEQAGIAGLATAPLVVGFLAQGGHLSRPFYVLAAVLVALLPLLREAETDAGEMSSTRTSSLSLLRDRRVVGVMLIVTSGFINIGAYESLWSVQLKELGAETWQIGVSFAVFSIPLIALAPYGGRLGQRRNGVVVASIGMIATAVTSVSFGLIASVWGLIAISVIVDIGDGIGFPAGSYAYSQTVHERRQAAAQGLLGATQVLLAGLSSVLAAVIYDNFGRTTAWIVIPALMLACIVVGLILVRGTADRPPA